MQPGPPDPETGGGPGNTKSDDPSTCKPKAPARSASSGSLQVSEDQASSASPQAARYTSDNGRVATASVPTSALDGVQSEKSLSPVPPQILRKPSGASPQKAARRRDSFSSLSAMGAETLHAKSHDHKVGPAKRSLPLLLTAFVCVVAGISGLVVTGVHYVVLYSGCPLGINGCNEFHHMEDKGFILPRWWRDLTDAKLPESIMYIVVATLGALLFSLVLVLLPGDLVFQLSGGGTLQSLVAVASGERIPMRAAFLRVIATSLYLGSGGTLGGEGPAIQVCTSVAMFVGWMVGIQAHQTQSLLACIGISCGFAASFNSPLAGTLFAMEELQHISPSLSKTLVCCILVASVVATATVRASHGNTQVFKVQWTDRSQADTDALFGSGLWMLVAVPIGLVCSLTGALITLSVRFLHKQGKRYLSRWPYPAAFTMQAFVAACVGAAVYHATGLRGVWGIGVGSLQKAFDTKEGLEAWVYIVFALGKVAAMVFAVAMRAPGDVLEPVLISGGFVGGFVGRISCYILDIPNSDIMTPCVIFGMVANFAACFRFPLTPVVIVLELTGIGSYAIILPTALASFTAITVSSRLCRPLFDEIMHEDGIDLEELIEEAAHDRESEIWIDPSVSADSCKEIGIEVQENGLAPPNPDTMPRRERRPSRCFVDMEEMLNEYCSPPSAGSITPPRSHSKASCGEEGNAVGAMASRQFAPRFRERSNSVSSGRSSGSHNGSKEPPTDLSNLPGRRPPVQRPRSNSVGSAGSQRGAAAAAAAAAAAVTAAAASAKASTTAATVQKEKEYDTV